MDVETRVYRVPIHHGGEKLRGEIEGAEKLVSRMEITEQKWDEKKEMRIFDDGQIFESG